MGRPLEQSAFRVLTQIGQQLDQGRFPRVMNGGVVVPSDAGIHPSTLGTEHNYVFRPAERGPSARSWQRAAGRQRTSSGPRTPGSTAPLLGAAGSENHESELSEVREAYPDAQCQDDDHGYWLIVRSTVLEGLDKAAQFFVAVASGWFAVRGWAFWTHPVMTPEWIGPRHTNFFDGSICAFEPSDETWRYGDSFVSLLDLYTVWALRHLHLQILGRWPGYQAVHRPVERLLELRDDEYCGCGTTSRLYGECCRAKDRSVSHVREAVQLALSPRCPPRSLVTSAIAARQLPRIADVLI